MQPAQEPVGGLQARSADVPGRIQTHHDGLGDLAGASLPDLADRLEVALGVRRQHGGLPGLGETGDNRPGAAVGQGVILGHLTPGPVFDIGLRAGGRRRRGMTLPGRRRIAHHLGVDERRLRTVSVDAAPGRQCGDDPPPQIGVDLKSGQAALGRIAVEQVGQQHEMVSREHGRAQRVDVCQLMVRARVGRSGQLQQTVGECRPAMLGGPVRLGVGVQRGLRLYQQPLRHPHLSLGPHTAGHQCDEVACLQFGVAGHLPGRRPHQCPGEGFGDIGDSLRGEFQ